MKIFNTFRIHCQMHIKTHCLIHVCGGTTDIEFTLSGFESFYNFLEVFRVWFSTFLFLRSKKNYVFSMTIKFVLMNSLFSTWQKHFVDVQFFQSFQYWPMFQAAETANKNLPIKVKEKKLNFFMFFFHQFLYYSASSRTKKN